MSRETPGGQGEGGMPDDRSPSAERAPASGDPRREVIRFDARLAPEVFAFQQSAYPHRRRDWIEPRWRWMFLDSAARVGVEPLVWLCRDETGVVGQRAAIAVRLHTRAGTLPTGWLVDTAVLPHRRGQAIGKTLVARATRDLPVSLSLGQTEQMRALQSRHGWQHVATMDSWLVVLNVRRAFRGRVRLAAMRVAIASAGWLWWRLCSRIGSRDERVRRLVPRSVEVFDDAHDRLWTRVRDRFGCAVERDASYLNWKYVAQPGQSFRRVEVRDGDEVRGVCVWSVHEPDGRHAYRRGWILDLVVDPTDDVAIAALLRAVCASAVAAGVDLLECDLLGRHLAQRLRRHGFVRGAQTRHLRVSTAGADAAVAALMRSPEAWYATRGDSDGDHPWWTPAGRQGVG